VSWIDTPITIRRAGDSFGYRLRAVRAHEEVAWPVIRVCWSLARRHLGQHRGASCADGRFVVIAGSVLAARSPISPITRGRPALGRCGSWAFSLRMVCRRLGAIGAAATVDQARRSTFALICFYCHRMTFTGLFSILVSVTSIGLRRLDNTRLAARLCGSDPFCRRFTLWIACPMVFVLRSLWILAASVDGTRRCFGRFMAQACRARW